jgi:hypothetical protein
MPRSPDPTLSISTPSDNTKPVNLEEDSHERSTKPRNRSAAYSPCRRIRRVRGRLPCGSGPGSEAATSEEPPVSRPRQSIADFIVESMKDLPPEIMLDAATATMPTDGASQHDHYIYGWPKREV